MKEHRGDMRVMLNLRGVRNALCIAAIWSPGCLRRLAIDTFGLLFDKEVH